MRPLISEAGLTTHIDTTPHDFAHFGTTSKFVHPRKRMHHRSAARARGRARAPERESGWLSRRAVIKKVVARLACAAAINLRFRELRRYRYIRILYNCFQLRRDQHAVFVGGARRAPILAMLPGTTDGARDKAREGNARVQRAHLADSSECSPLPTLRDILRNGFPEQQMLLGYLESASRLPPQT
jgi:hypothetical protein